jgi:hypothetical protein
MLDQKAPVDVTAIPVGQRCLFCEEVITENDQGVLMPLLDSQACRLVPKHRECYLRHIFGSVGHQMKTCSCYGGTQEDPEGMTRREAAKAAVELFELNHKWEEMQSEPKDPNPLTN